MRKLTMFLLSCGLMGAVWAQEKPADEVANDLPPRGGTIPIPDNGYDGTLASMACRTVAVATAGTVDEVQVNVALEHTWVGDLTFKVVSPMGTVATVMSRPGLVETADDGTGCCGDSSDLVLTSPLDFLAGGTTDAEDMGSTIAGGGASARSMAFAIISRTRARHWTAVTWPQFSMGSRRPVTGNSVSVIVWEPTPGISVPCHSM